MPDHDPGQLTSRQRDRYASQLARCLKALGTDAPSVPTSSANWRPSAPGKNHAPARFDSEFVDLGDVKLSISNWLAVNR